VTALNSTVTLDHKLPNPSPSRRGDARRTSNAWLEADRREKTKTYLTIALVAIMLATGLWLIIGAATN
jgi:hypothetical protein